MVRILRNRLFTDDNLRKCGMCITSFCRMCMRSDETVSHLFLHCPFANVVWQWLANKFRIVLDAQDSFAYFFKRVFDVHFSSHVNDLWLAAVVAAIWGIWTQRNACKFEDTTPNFQRLCDAIEGWVRDATILSNGVMSITVQDLLIIKSFGA